MCSNEALIEALQLMMILFDCSLSSIPSIVKAGEFAVLLRPYLLLGFVGYFYISLTPPVLAFPVVFIIRPLFVLGVSVVIRSEVLKLALCPLRPAV